MGGGASSAPLVFLQFGPLQSNQLEQLLIIHCLVSTSSVFLCCWNSGCIVMQGTLFYWVQHVLALTSFGTLSIVAVSLQIWQKWHHEEFIFSKLVVAKRFPYPTSRNHYKNVPQISGRILGIGTVSTLLKWCHMYCKKPISVEIYHLDITLLTCQKFVFNQLTTQSWPHASCCFKSDTPQLK